MTEKRYTAEELARDPEAVRAEIAALRATFDAMQAEIQALWEALAALRQREGARGEPGNA